jgi:hypothetical protein
MWHSQQPFKCIQKFECPNVLIYKHIKALSMELP